MSTNSKSSADNFVTGWVTTAGIDLLMKRSGEEFRARGIPYNVLTGDLKSDSGKSVPVSVRFTDSDDVFFVNINGLDVELQVQLKGHFFGWLQRLDKAEPMSLANARRLAAKAMADRASKATADAAAAITDDCPF